MQTFTATTPSDPRIVPAFRVYAEGTPWGSRCRTSRVHSLDRPNTEYLRGVEWISTDRHGGFRVSRSVYATLPSCVQRVSFTADQFFEEDCAWAALAYWFTLGRCDAEYRMARDTFIRWNLAEFIDAAALRNPSLNSTDRAAIDGLLDTAAKSIESGDLAHAAHYLDLSAKSIERAGLRITRRSRNLVVRRHLRLVAARVAAKPSQGA